MAIERMIQSPRYSGIVKNNGRIYLTGVTSPAEGITAQTKDVLSRIEERLAMAGSDKDHILRAMIYLKDITMFDEMNKVWDAWVNPETAPARACVQASLARENILIEIVVDAVEK